MIKLLVIFINILLEIISNNVRKQNFPVLSPLYQKGYVVDFRGSSLFLFIPSIFIFSETVNRPK